MNGELYKGLPMLCANCGWKLKEIENPCPNCGTLLNWRSKRRIMTGTRKEGEFVYDAWYVYPVGWSGWKNALRGIYTLDKRGTKIELGG